MSLAGMPGIPDTPLQLHGVPLEFEGLQHHIRGLCGLPICRQTRQEENPSLMNLKALRQS
jgi:hypothetical protein